MFLAQISLFTTLLRPSIAFDMSVSKSFYGSNSGFFSIEMDARYTEFQTGCLVQKSRYEGTAEFVRCIHVRMWDSDNSLKILHVYGLK